MLGDESDEVKKDEMPAGGSMSHCGGIQQQQALLPNRKKKLNFTI